ncbi:hypothetical protein AMJ49_02320 [Parcubacteria bacterium DG_74_2]|nr:MAG: hypothetical protein AMJ49_02320 [Parcubacteria bacterium DG_74_2]
MFGLKEPINFMKKKTFTLHHFNIIQKLKNIIHPHTTVPQNGLGFTLIEFFIYIAILISILALTTGFLWNVVLGNIKENSYQEVQQNGRFSLTKITQEIKKAEGIINPPLGFSTDSLSLEMADSNLNPTIFYLAEGKLTITQGSNPPYPLTSDRVVIKNLKFTNLSYENTPGTIRIEMTIEHSNPTGRIEYQASIDFKLTVSLVESGATP